VAEEYAGRFSKPAKAILRRMVGPRTPRDDIAILTVAVTPAVGR
jgi:hypothetical protein